MDRSYMWCWGSLGLCAAVFALTACSSPDWGPSSANGGGGGGGGGLATGTYTLAWDPVTIDPNVTGYRIYYNTVPIATGGALGHVDVGAATTAVDFQPGSYGIRAGSTLYIAVSSTGLGGAESPVSTSASKEVQ